MVLGNGVYTIESEPLLNDYLLQRARRERGLGLAGKLTAAGNWSGLAEALVSVD